MPSWETLNLVSIFPDEIVTLLSNSRSAVEDIADIVSTLSTFIDVASSVVIDFIDPIDVIVRELIESIQTYVSLFLDSSISVLFIPIGLSGNDFRQSTDEFLSVIENSFYDNSDSNRPKFSASDSFFSTILFAGSSDFSGIIDISNKLAKIFRTEKLIISEPFDVAKSVFLGKDIIGSLTPQSIEVSGDISSFPSSGIIKIGTENTTYGGKTDSLLMGVIARVSHTAGEEINPVARDGFPEATSTRLTAPILSAGLETNIEVEGTDGFPSFGSIRIGSETVSYKSKDETKLKGIITSNTYEDGTAITLISGRSFHGSPPDWNTISGHDLIKDFNLLNKYLDNFSKSIESSYKFSEQVQIFLTELIDKVNRMRRTIEKLLSFILNLIDILSNTSVSLLAIEGSGKLSDFIETIKSADGKPDFDENSYTCGIMFLAKGSNTDALAKIFEV